MLNFRGDVPGMFLFFTFLFLGLWQLLVAWKRLNGLSLTGYPDRRWASLALGLSLVVTTCLLYFSRPGHFASPDVEGMETLVLMALGITCASIIQASLSSVFFSKRAPGSTGWNEIAGGSQDTNVFVDGEPVSGTYWIPSGGPGTGVPVLLVHDYGGTRQDMAYCAAFLKDRGHPVLAIDLDGHGANPRGLSSPLMEDLLCAASSKLRELASSNRSAVVGLGFGGICAIRLTVSDEAVLRAVAIDPPAREAGGEPAINAARELKFPALIRAALKPPARESGGARISLYRLLERAPLLEQPASGRVELTGTEKAWLNSPGTLKNFAAERGFKEPALLAGKHSDQARLDRTLLMVEEKLG